MSFNELNSVENFLRDTLAGSNLKRKTPTFRKKSEFSAAEEEVQLLGEV